jgi:hypothetical protein
MNYKGTYKVIVVKKSTYGGRTKRQYNFNNEAHAEAWYAKWHTKMDIAEFIKPN